MTAVSGVFAKETGYGFAFTVARDPGGSLASATAPAEPRSARPGSVTCGNEREGQGQGKARLRICRSSSSVDP